MATTTANDTVSAESVRATAAELFGMVPNLVTEMTDHNPAAGDVYLSANAKIETNGVLSPAEQQAVILAISSYNDCHYCIKAHAVAGQQAGLDPAVIDEINAGGLPADERLRSLVRATRRILGKRGWLSDADETEFSDLGLNRPELYEIITLIGIKTISNYINHIAGTEVDAAFQD
jgi:AhpD family alkylhydroperoxidase